MGQPGSLELYNLIEMEGIKIYINKALPYSRELALSQLQGLLI